MAFSIFLAKIFGIYLVVLSLAFLSNKGLLKAVLNLYKNRVVLFFSGVFNLVLGVVLVLMHNQWVSDWRIIITLFGWVGIIKGFVRIFMPQYTLSLVRKIDKSNVQKYILIACFILGVYLLLAGFSS